MTVAPPPFKRCAASSVRCRAMCRWFRAALCPQSGAALYHRFCAALYHSAGEKEKRGKEKGKGKGKGNKKKRARGFLLELSVRGRLPTLPLSQYHRRGEA